MIKEKEISLKQKLKRIIKEIGLIMPPALASKIKEDTASEFMERNLSGFRAALVFSENLDLNTFTDSDDDIRFLFIFTFALNKALLNQKEVDISIDVKDYFTEVEINQWKNYKKLEKRKIFILLYLKTLLS